MGVAAIVLALAVTVLWADDPIGNAPQANPGAIPSSISLPAGFQAKDLNEQNDIKNTLATVTEHAFTKDQFNDLCDDLVKQDKDRIGKYQDRDVTKLNGRIDQIRKAWKEKYNEDFDFDNAKTVFNDRYQIVQGEVTDPSVAVVTWPVPAMPGEAMKASETQRPDAARDKTEAAEDAKLDKGRNVALVRVSATQDQPGLIVSMVHQLPDNWKIDIPNNRTGEQVYNDLLTHLTWVGEHSAQWPANKDDAYRMFAHCTLASLYGAPMDKAMPGGASDTR
jgi:hypothetical protein